MSDCPQFRWWGVPYGVDSLGEHLRFSSRGAWSIADLYPDGKVVGDRGPAADAAAAYHRLRQVPDGARTFTVTTFGMYTPRGFDPTKVASRVSGLDVFHWPGNWLFCSEGPHQRIDFFDDRRKLVQTVWA